MGLYGSERVGNFVKWLHRINPRSFAAIALKSTPRSERIICHTSDKSYDLIIIILFPFIHSYIYFFSVPIRSASIPTISRISSISHYHDRRIPRGIVNLLANPWSSKYRYFLVLIYQRVRVVQPDRKPLSRDARLSFLRIACTAGLL